MVIYRLCQNEDTPLYGLGTEEAWPEYLNLESHVFTAVIPGRFLQICRRFRG